MQLKLTSTILFTILTVLLYTFVVECSLITSQIDENFKIVSSKFLKMEVKNCQQLKNVVIYGYINRKIDLWSFSDFSKNFLIDLKSGSCFAHVKIDPINTDKIDYILYFDRENQTYSKRSSVRIQGKTIERMFLIFLILKLIEKLTEF